MKAELPKGLKTEEEVTKFFDEIKSSDYLVENIEQKPGIRNPSPPFTTSSLQQEASSKLGFSVKQTMIGAQKLYESGHITYMRTDSTSLSQDSLNAAGAYIEKSYGGDYHELRVYKVVLN